MKNHFKNCCLIPILLALLLLTACGSETPEFSEASQPPRVTVPETTAVPTVEETGFSFADVADLEFLFTSGAGGWGTRLYIHEDGSFDGAYHDSDFETGPGYPNGTYYCCEFSGRFARPEPVNDTTWRLRIEEMTVDRLGEEIRDGVRYVYFDEPYGLEGAEELYLYAPGTKVAELPRGYLDWAWLDQSAVELTGYGLYNQAGESGFYSYEPTSAYDLVMADIAYTEETAEAITQRLLNAQTQAEMNEAAEALYWAWDSLLNSQWSYLKVNLDSQAMAELTDLQLEWIAEKETAAKEAAAEVEGGSMYPMVYYGKAAELTRDRVYFLTEYLK